MMLTKHTGAGRTAHVGCLVDLGPGVQHSERCAVRTAADVADCRAGCWAFGARQQVSASALGIVIDDKLGHRKLCSRLEVDWLMACRGDACGQTCCRTQKTFKGSAPYPVIKSETTC